MKYAHLSTDPRVKYVAASFRLGMCAALMFMAGHAQAQTIYRVVDPDGKITFSDKPPAAADKSMIAGAGGKTAGETGATLPYELRQVANRYPVTLYTASNCTPCGSGRTLLSTRGIPFAEKTVTTAEDSEALKRLSGESSLPFLTIGGQQIKGFSDAEWTQFLDAAGYPKSSLLPAGYRNPAAAPLVMLQKPAPAAKPEETRAAPVPKSPPVDPQSNPAGITF
jgi:glutaredoxin